MTVPMTAVFAKDTEHVLALLTRTDAPESPISLEAAVGDGLPLHHPTEHRNMVTVAAERLDVALVEAEESALLSPRTRRVDGSALVALGAGPAASVDLSVSGVVTVDAGAPVIEEAPFIVQLERTAPLAPDEPPLVITGSIQAGAQSASVAESVLSGTYRVLILIRGQKPSFADETAP